MALVLGFLTWPLNFFLEGEFNMSVWAFGFDALAAAAVMVYDFTRYDAMQVHQYEECFGRTDSSGWCAVGWVVCSTHAPFSLFDS